MKRKRGKKGKAKAFLSAVAAKAAVADSVSLRGEDDRSGVGEIENNHENESAMEVDTPSSTGTDQLLNAANNCLDGTVQKPAGKSVGRVKVKLKTSKILESGSDTDKSSLQLGLEKKGVASDKMEDSGNSLVEVKAGASENISKRPGSIKIKSSKATGGTSLEKSGGGAVVGLDKGLQQREAVTPRQASQYNKQELDSALMIIKKVMKMDAAEPFNVPVNPEALGIPDYFDIIDTPMDFGTICSNLEKGDKYMNSEDVYNDVQYIWDNCYKYNSKGDYILDLLKRVKKNFMKCWIAAGLYTEQSTGTSGTDSIHGEDAAGSNLGLVKSGQLKQKTKKRHGRRHKGDCLCAICVLKRRRREREERERLAKCQMGITDNKLAQEFKQEDSSLVESPGGEDSSSNVDDLLDPDGNAEMEGAEQDEKVDVSGQQSSPMEEKPEEEEEEEGEEDEEEEGEEKKVNEIEMQTRGKDEMPEQSLFPDRSGEGPNQQSQPSTAENSGAGILPHSEKEHTLAEQEQEKMAVQQKQDKELQERQKKAKMLENFYRDNPMLLKLCETLFPHNRRSVWSGPHSLFQLQTSAPRNSIHAAVDTLMK